MISIYSFVWTLIICGIMALLIYFLRKQTVFLERYGTGSLIVLSVCCIIRMLLPFEFPNYQYSIDDPYIYVVISSIAKYINFSRETLYIICGMWIIGIIIYCCWLCKKYRKTLNMLEEFAVLDEEAQEILSSKIDSSCKIPVHRTSAVSVPLITGLNHPVIYIPIEPYSDKEIEYILLHEYTHYKRKDLWKKFVLNLLCALVWWNPVIYVIRDEIVKLIEFNCDKSLSKKFEDFEVIDYLDTLVNAAKYNSKFSKDLLLFTIEFVAVKNPQSIEQRIDLLMDNKEYKGKNLRKLFVILFAAVWMASSYYFLWQPKYDTPSGELWDETTSIVAGADNAYLEEQEDGTYLFHLEEYTDIISAEDIESGIYKEYPIISYKGSLYNKWLVQLMKWLKSINFIN